MQKKNCDEINKAGMDALMAAVQNSIRMRHAQNMPPPPSDSEVIVQSRKLRGGDPKRKTL